MVLGMEALFKECPDIYLGKPESGERRRREESY
jgi:hypothetical protein